ncbi:DUF5908 family protein [Ascidiimonas aurantiaca]|uniref:DUF5908 family protein n=1 Tax=Ascidiimonas aurantiaca TaxID=1685432 RepID=UPI0030EB6E6E
MPIEIRELLIKVKIEDSQRKESDQEEFDRLRQSILRECRNEIKRQLNRTKER